MRPHRFTKNHRTRHGRRCFRLAAPALLLSTASVLSIPCTAVADDTAEDLRQLRAAIQKELADLKKREQKLHQEFLRLDQKSQLLDDQLRKLRAAGVGPGGANPSAAAGGVTPPASAEGSPKPAVSRRTAAAAAGACLVARKAGGLWIAVCLQGRTRHLARRGNDLVPGSQLVPGLYLERQKWPELISLTH